MNKDIYEIGYGHGEEDYGRSIDDCDKAIARHNTLNGSPLSEDEEDIFYDGYSDAQDTCRADEDYIRGSGF
ncbi:hypothetical protein [Liquorilactobacillus mali]|uniref:Uncharacterized protein n=1 Tax=Liquorilactobacillus mali KCTC 3596 = DSM 20444 TaxID=1046596 RepID=A0A0R2ED95_9LACO|nr:hypothetical protein [Liquorilactobacillus mali]KRN10762.1 hypothetical protein FD00_GL002003 [Liquorilactobacillus mali KCTC 3596 = DSM 20444]